MNKKAAVILMLFLFVGILTPSIASAASTFTLTVQEQGLPSNTLWTGYITNYSYTWSVNSNAFEEKFSLPNGTFYYQFNDTSNGYKPLNNNGYFTVANNTYTLVAQYVPINTTTKFKVDFTPKGLPSDTNWTLTFNNLQYTGNASINVSIVSGSYSWSATASGYTTNGSVLFVTKNESVNVTFTKQQYQGWQSGLNTYFEDSFGVSMSAVWAVVSLIVGMAIGVKLYTLFNKRLEIVPLPVVALFVTGAVLGFLTLNVLGVVLVVIAAAIVVGKMTEKRGSS